MSLAQTGTLVCIDPGHPSENGVGARGKRITEVKAAWQVAKRLEAELKARGIRVVLTKKSEGERVTNQARAEFANRAGADLTIRLHCDATGGSGFMTVYPARQGTVRGVTGPSREVIRASGLAAKAFHPAAMKTLKGQLKDRGVKTDMHTAIGRKQGALTGSIFSKVPVILVEMCVLTNRTDDAFIASTKGQVTIGRALAEGAVAALKAINRTQIP